MGMKVKINNDTVIFRGNYTSLEEFLKKEMRTNETAIVLPYHYGSKMKRKYFFKELDSKLLLTYIIL